MRDIIGLTIGLYLTAALVVMGAGIYGFMSGEAPRPASCEGQGPTWLPYALLRGAIWPKAYFDEQELANGVTDWLLVRYDPFNGGCG